MNQAWKVAVDLNAAAIDLDLSKISNRCVNASVGKIGNLRYQIIFHDRHQLDSVLAIKKTLLLSYPRSLKAQLSYPFVIFACL